MDAPTTGSELHLVLFDVDGTLLDGAPAIAASMARAFAAIGRPAPDDAAVRAVIGLDLAEAIDRLAAPGGALTPAESGAAVEAYRQAFVSERAEGRGEAGSPLYPGVREALARLSGGDLLLGVATGKARRGLDFALQAHDLGRFFVTTQTASEGPGKPHPAMIERALAETGADAARTAMVGDAIYDMQMARNAGARAIGVSWGYHSREALIEAGAEIVIDRIDGLETALETLWGTAWRA